VLDYDGGDRTLRCLEALAATEWDGELEVVLVDNGSARPVTDEAAHRWPSVRIVRSEQNRGFAGGCNLGIGDVDEVDAVALVNNDALVSRNWLAPLVAALEHDEQLGAACSKIVLAGRYRTLELAAPPHAVGPLDGRRVGVRVHAVEPQGAHLVRGFDGPEVNRDGSTFEWAGPVAVIEVPDDGRGDGAAARLRLGSDRPTEVTARSGDVDTVIAVARGTGWYDVALGGESHALINNVGTELHDDWYAGDRGYMEIDHGQYDIEEDVEAWCGAAVLLRGSYLRDVGLFDERLFLYCEDLDLSLRGARHGWRYRLVPASVVEHEHSATAISGSARAEFFKERNRLVVVARYASRRDLARVVARHALATASYAKRDVVAPLLRGERPHARWVNVRTRALAQFWMIAMG
jgi:GT2 family glycosyltransferase